MVAGWKKICLFVVLFAAWLTLFALFFDRAPAQGVSVGGASVNMVIGVGTGTTGAVTGTLAAAAGRTTFICGFDVSVIGGTAAVGPITITGLIGGTFTYQFSSLAAGNTLSRTFTPCIPASAVNTAIVTTTTADGTASAVDVNSWGYQQ